MEGQILKKLREETHKTQKQVAKDLGYHTTTYARWEQDQYNMKLIDVINIARYFNVSIDYIAGLTSNKKINSEISDASIIVNQNQNTKAIVNIVDKNNIK